MWSLLLPSGREASSPWGECTYASPCTICATIHPREHAYMDKPTHPQMDTQTHPYTIANTCDILYSQIQPPDQVASTYPHSQHACPSHTLLHRQHAAYSTDALDWVHKVYSKLFVTGKPTLAGQTLFSMLQSLQCSLRLMKCEYINTFGPRNWFYCRRCGLTTIFIGLSSTCTVEPLYRGHHWDPSCLGRFVHGSMWSGLQTASS